MDAQLFTKQGRASADSRAQIFLAGENQAFLRKRKLARRYSIELKGARKTKQIH